MGFGRLAKLAAPLPAPPAGSAAIQPSSSGLLWTALALASGATLLLRHLRLRRRRALEAPNDECQYPIFGPFLTEVEIRRAIADIAARGRGNEE